MLGILVTTVEAFIAANRFGLGSRPGELAAIAPDPRAWLEDQLGPVDGAAPFIKALPRGRETLAAFLRARSDREKLRRFRKEVARPLYLREAAARTFAGAGTSTPFRERLVQFWSNHFSVSINTERMRHLAGAFEREAIRPHVTGPFVDMLAAVVHHPAMLVYLDNVLSIGPTSELGRRTQRHGLNENLAREILELHTIGVDGGYDQADVVNLAKMLTGWTFSRVQQPDAGAFSFNPRAHEPGAKVLLGRTYAEDGVHEAEAALRALARHPSTARFVATKLARHFVADDPPASAVGRLRRTFLDSEGDLGEIARTLVTIPETWQYPLAKVKTPNDLVVSAFRLLGTPKEEARVVEPLRLLGQMPFLAPSPAGWPDTAASWIGPEVLLRRIEVLGLIAKRYSGSVDVRATTDAAFGPVAGEDTVAAIGRATGTGDALTLLLASPEFQRR